MFKNIISKINRWKEKPATRSDLIILVILAPIIAVILKEILK